MHTILIVDDLPANREFLITLLRGRGHRLLEAGDGVEALEIARRERPKLVIADIVMPRLDGYSLARRLADYPQLRETQVILCSAAYDEKEARALVRHCGVWRLLAKPCEPELVLDVVEQALRETRPREVSPAGTPVTDEQLGVVGDKLHQKIAELERLQGELERRVEDRTRELQREVRERQQAQQALDAANRRLREESLRDGLTGLYNRRCLDEVLQREIAQAVRHERSLSLLLIDIDHFKQCNDRFGHAAGDAMLRAVSTHLRAAFREEDTVCRYGGDEFVVLMPGTTPVAARDCADRLRSRMRELQIVQEGSALPPVTLSIGVASMTTSRRSVTAMLQAADRALYRVKQAGRDQAQLSSDYMALDLLPPHSAALA
ncbi:diguanylate cyclase [Aquincola sp. S2]|uniref:diguanylate cyclase n=1 Tax=Pseudaquabacterium terrae TaxID=2732868 RepID=A0ABX2ER17_9BURK|nr:diguanylate cyclase [Aquabacterium terrae]NRF71101.1 diguanylate cyclase [Aquabacterium terrae]